eukprot:105129-Pleurochrysis_carterae.AAC.7
MTISYNTNSQRSGSERGRGDWARLRGWLRVGGAQARSAMRATGAPEVRERRASAPQVRMRSDCNFGNCACER